MAKARGLRGSFGQAEMLKERGVNLTKALPAELLELAIENEKSGFSASGWPRTASAVRRPLALQLGRLDEASAGNWQPFRRAIIISALFKWLFHPTRR
jgi:hypothetical protein